MASSSSSSSSSSSAATLLDPYYAPDPFYSEEFSEHEQQFNNGVREVTVSDLQLQLVGGTRTICDWKWF
jgi:hypothetical protein